MKQIAAFTLYFTDVRRNNAPLILSTAITAVKKLSPWSLRPSSAALLCSLLLASLPFISFAYDQVEHNGKLYACQTRCTISHLPDGRTHIYDSNGGWAARIEVNGGIIVEEERTEPQP